jgi:hypothetical protein
MKTRSERAGTTPPNFPTVTQLEDEGRPPEGGQGLIFHPEKKSAPAQPCGASTLEAKNTPMPRYWE